MVLKGKVERLERFAVFPLATLCLRLKEAELFTGWMCLAFAADTIFLLKGRVTPAS